MIESLATAKKEELPDYRTVMHRRLMLVDAMRRDPDLAALERELCARDAAHFISTWCFTYDPRYRPFHFPFVLWQYQKDFCGFLEERFRAGENGLVEKSRDMGVTWTWVAWCLHKWLFEQSFTSLWGSRKEELVDDGTIDSLFGKARYLLSRLPETLKPILNDHEDRHLVLQNPHNGNELVGESANLNFGRQGRYSMVFITEFAFVEHSEAVWAGVSETSNTCIVESNPNGKGNQFAWLRHETNIPVSTLHWTIHPRKDRGWYEKKCEQMQSWQIAQELDISYERSKFGRIYSRFDRAWHIADRVIECKIEWEQFVTWDFGRAGAMAMVWGQISPQGVVEIWNCFELQGYDIDFFLPIIKGDTPVHSAFLEAKDLKKLKATNQKIPKEYPDALPYCIGDHAGTAKTANSTRSCKDAIEEAGYEFRSSGKQGYDWRFDCLDALLKLKYDTQTGKFRSRFLVSPDCKRLIDCMNNATWDSENLHSDSIKPKNDEYFHMVSAVEFLAINRFPIRSANTAKSQEWR